jgi:thiol-disulfide isomerase/thioredoxin
MSRPKSFTRSLYGLILASLSVGMVMAISSGSARADDPRRPGAPTGGRPILQRTADQQARGPSLEGGTGWINSAGPIRMEDLRGKVVLLDFWTYCCINCHHVLPDLARLEEKYKNELVVIGVHTAKFFAERETENIRRKVREYGIKHPVINDANQVLWTQFGVDSWPTLVLIDVDGRLARFDADGNVARDEGNAQYFHSISGEGHYTLLDKVIGQLVARAKARKTLNEAPVMFFPENEKPDNTPLLFPGKVLADVEGRRLFIADTGHNRIVQADLQGKGPKTIGTGVPGLVDGAYDKAGFNRPQGMCLVGETLYVADTENHAIRAVDLKARTVTTLAGNGQQSQAHRRPGTGSGPGKLTSLNSPWDVILVPGTRSLLIAMAGPHQIWRYDLDSGIIGAWAGSGEENIVDGLLPTAAFAQPSGLATDGTHLYVADSEVSAVRAISLDKRSHRVSTIVGVGLFGFDDIDGTGDEVRLQHCLGVSYGNGKLYIVDTYNNKIKVCDPKTRAVETFVGAHQPGDGDNPARFYQPGGLSVAGSNLYVADTNNQAVRVVDLKERRVRTLVIDGLTPPAPKPRTPSFPNAQAVPVGPVQVAPGGSITLDVTVPLAAKSKLNTDAPMPYLLETPGKTGLLSADLPASGGKVSPPSQTFSVDVPLAKSVSAGDAFDLKLSAAAFVCNEGSGLCLIKSYVWTIPVHVASNASDPHVALSVKPPDREGKE